MTTNTLAGLSLRYLEYAVAVGDLLHFGRAAERCAVSQAGLSEQVRKLEALLGVALFDRTTRRIVVTPEGELVLRQAREVLAAARVLVEMAHSRSEPLAGPLRLGVIATLGPYYIPGVLRTARSAFPQLELRLEEGRTARLLQDLQGGQLDAVLLALPVPVETVAAVPLFFEPFRAALPANHPLAVHPTLAMRDLAGAGLLLLEEGHCLRDQALSLCGNAREAGGAREAVGVRFASSLEMLRHMIAAGEGVSLLPALAAQERSDLDGLLLLRDLHGKPVGRTVGLAWRGTDPRAPAFGEFAAFLRRTAPEGTAPPD
jgi:LysR family hydrogen peroxide-inducible transcriptional activator